MPNNRICTDDIPRLDLALDSVQATQGPHNVDILARRKEINFIGG